MANFTQSIREILQMNKHPLESLSKITDIEAIALRTLFDGEAIDEAIKTEYKERLVTGFTLHFMNDEIGYETLPLWKLALEEKLYNNGSYINQIFDNLDKEVFADYKVSNLRDQGDENRDKLSTMSGQDDRNVLSSGTDDKDITYGKLTTDSKVDNRTLGGSIDVTKMGSEYRKRDGNDDLEMKGAEYQKHGGQDSTTDNGVQDTINSSASTNRSNAIQVQSDTPMGSLQNLRTPGGEPGTYSSEMVPYDPDSEQGFDFRAYNPDVPTGQNLNGSGYEAAQTYNYMSGAVESGQSDVSVDNSSQKVINSGGNTVTHGLSIATEYGTKDGSHYTDNDKRKNITNYNNGETVTYGKGLIYDEETGEWDVGEDDRIDRTEDHRTDDLVSTGSTGTSGTDTTRGTTSNTVSDVVDRTQSGSQNDTAHHDNTVDKTDYSMNLEMLYKSMPLLNKVWEIFDDLFMLIY